MPMTNNPYQGRQLLCTDLHLELHGSHILNGVDFALSPGELVGILGSNGAGKSSLLKSIVGIHKPSSGQIRLGDQGLAMLAPRHQAQCIAYLAQGQQAHWPQTVEKVVMLGRIPHVRHPAHDVRIAGMVMEQVGITHLRQRNVQTLSGGERARTLLARALAIQAPVLLADEPLAALDPAHQLRIMQLLQEQARQGLAVAVVLHDLALAMRFCSRIVVLHEGKKIADGEPHIACSDQNLAQAFGIDVARVSWDGGAFAVPWSTQESV